MKRLGKILAVIIALLVIAFVIFRTPDTDPAEMRAKYGSEPSQFVELDNGLTVHLRDEGPREAPVIVLLHGTNSDLHIWQGWADGLKDQYRVIRYDQRGHGLTGPAPDDAYLVQDFGSDLQAVVQALGVEQFVLVGHSMGGWISAGYALDHQTQLAGLVLIDASGSPVKNEGPVPIGFRIARTPIVRDAAKHFMPRSIFEKSMSQSISNQEIATESEIDRYWELNRYPGNRDATMKRFATERREYSAEEIAGLEMPALVMWGEEDSLIPLAAGEWYDEKLPNSTLVTYPAIGHIPQQENAAQSVSDLRAWLEQLYQPEPEA